MNRIELDRDLPEIAGNEVDESVLLIFTEEIRSSKISMHASVYILTVLISSKKKEEDELGNLPDLRKRSNGRFEMIEFFHRKQRQTQTASLTVITKKKRKE